MIDKQKHLEDLAEIRAMMERSSRFLSLSGLSGVWAGVCALAGAYAVYAFLGQEPLDFEPRYYSKATGIERWGMDYKSALLLIGCAVLLAALTGGVFFTTRKARRQGKKIWDPSTKRLLAALAVPLLAGGVFCLALLYWDIVGLVAPATLVFYGLALVNGSKFTIKTVYYLGISEIVLGLVAMFLIGHGLEFWALGFGILHIVYGLWMWKSEK